MATSIITPDEGVEILLGTFFNGIPAGQNMILRLYCNNYTPVRGSGVANFTEATGGGYAAKTLTNGSWSVSATTPRDANYTTQQFLFTGALTTNGTVYGYFVTNAAGTKVMWAQRLDTAFTPALNGDNLNITPKLQMSLGTPA